MTGWLEDLLNIIYPAECHICGHPLSPGERFICNPCIEGLPRTGYHRDRNNPMVEKFAGLFPFEQATGHFFYSRDSSIAQLIQDMKYRKYPSIGNKLGEIAGRELFISGFFYDIDIIVPLPMHFYKKAKRGYNQTDRIVSGLSEATGIHVVDALKMTRMRKTQTTLSGLERIKNAESLFAVKRNIDLNGKGVLLVDDICTTGTTLGSAARCLTEAFPGIRLSLMALGIAF